MSKQVKHGILNICYDTDSFLFGVATENSKQRALRASTDETMAKGSGPQPREGTNHVQMPPKVFAAELGERGSQAKTERHRTTGYNVTKSTGAVV